MFPVASCTVSSGKRPSVLPRGDVIVERHQGFQLSNLVAQSGNSFVQSLHAVANVEFNECVSQEQLQAAVENAQKRMNEAIRKAVTDALIELNIGNNMERLDKRISTLTDKVTKLETLVAVNNNDVSGSNTDGLLPEDTVHDAVGNIDRAAF